MVDIRMKKVKRISVMIAIVMFVNILNPIIIHGSNQSPYDMILKGYTDQEQLQPGKEGVNYDIDYIEMKIDTSEANISTEKLSKIKIYTQGKIDETDKFDINYSNGILKFELKYNNIKTYQLKKHTLYTINIPKGIFQKTSTNSYNNDIYYSFTTKTDESNYPNDILDSTSPINESHSLDTKPDKIIFEFIDDIAIEPDRLKNIEDYITLKSQPIHRDIPAYNEVFQGDDHISNYNINIDGSKLILESKNKTLKDFARYTIRLEADTVYLKNSSDTRIYNDAQTISFSTDNWLTDSYPKNNQENIELEPTLWFTFRYDIKILDKSKITLTSDNAESISLVANDKIILDSDEKTLQIRLDDHEETTYPLRKSTLYKLKIAEGALSFKDYNVINHDMEIFFITRGEGQGPLPIGYHSSQEAEDDIRYMDATDLDIDESIYVKFDRPIKWDKAYDSPEKVLKQIKLYQMPKWQRAYDAEGKAYDKELQFNLADLRYTDEFDASKKTSIIPSTALDAVDNLWNLEKEGNLQELIIEKVEITEDSNMVKITPLEPLQNLNKYKVFINRKILEDENDYNTPEDIIFAFWTKKSEDKTKPQWRGMNDIKAEEMKETNQVPYKSFQVYGVPQYGPNNPIIIEFQGEIIPNWTDETKEFGIVNKYTRITYEALKEITITDNINPNDEEKIIKIDKYKLQYLDEEGNKNTKLFLYPETVLDKGKEYSLKIPEGVLKTRGNVMIPTFVVNFTVEGDTSKGKGIFTMESVLRVEINKGEFLDWYLGSNSVNVTFLHYGELHLILKGYNFNERIKKAELTPFSGEAANLPPIEIRKEDIVFDNVTKLIVKVKGRSLEELAQESRTGEYHLNVIFEDNTQVTSPILTILSKNRPEPIGIFPKDDEILFDEYELFPREIDGVTRHFLRITYSNIEDKLIFNGVNGLINMRDTSVINATGSSTNMIDKEFITLIQNMDDRKRQEYIDKYLFVRDDSQKTIHLFIPIKLLSAGNIYNVTIGQDIIRYSDLPADMGGNNVITWSFSTMKIPFVKTVNISSVPEDYDESQPIIITGNSFFESSITVYFGKQKAEKVNVRTGPEGSYLHVYLPKGDKRLTPGIYEITVKNDDNHKAELVGSLSVVKSGTFVPNENYSQRLLTPYGEIHEALYISEGTLIMRADKCNGEMLELDLDNLLGEDTRSRRLEPVENEKIEIKALTLKSQWAEIILNNFTLEGYLLVGQADPSLIKIVKSRLGNSIPKSEFIQISGQDFVADRIELTIPYKNTDGRAIKVLRYDEEERSYEEEGFIKDPITRTVRVIAEKPGIFVITE